MKKLVLLIALLFAVGMQANTIKEKNDIKADVQKIEMPDTGGPTVHMDCTTTTHTYESLVDGVYTSITVTKTVCVLTEAQ